MVLAFSDAIVGWYMDHINYYTVTLFMTVESSFIPFPSEVVIPPAAWKAAEGDLNVYLVVLFGTMGAMIGALINYFIAKTVGRMLIYKLADSRFGHACLLDGDKVKKAEDYFVKYGNISTFIGRLIPAVRQLVSIPAGLAKMPLKAFCLFTALGALIWNIILALLGYFLQSQHELFEKYYSELCLAMVIVAVLFIGYLVYNGFKQPKTKQQ